MVSPGRKGEPPRPASETGEHAECAHSLHGGEVLGADEDGRHGVGRYRHTTQLLHRRIDQSFDALGVLEVQLAVGPRAYQVASPGIFLDVAQEPKDPLRKRTFGFAGAALERDHELSLPEGPEAVRDEGPEHPIQGLDGMGEDPDRELPGDEFHVERESRHRILDTVTAD